MASGSPKVRESRKSAEARSPIVQSERGKRDSSSRASVLHLLNAEQLGEGNGIVAVRAETAGPEAPAEDVAIGAALLAEEPGLAGRALVDGVSDERLA